MSLYRRKGQKIWAYDFWLSHCRFSGSTGTANKREAKRVLDGKRQEARQQIERQRAFASCPMTVEMAASRYWTEVAQHLVNKESAFKYLGWIVQQLGKHTLLRNVGDSSIAELVALRRADGVANATVNRSVTEPLRAILRRARDIWKQDVQNILWKEHWLKELQERVREASLDEEAELRSAIRCDYEPALHFAFLSGCRSQEIIDLEWRNVDFINRVITIVGKGDRTRKIPMTDAIYDLLWQLRGHHKTAVFTYVAVRSRDGRQKGLRYPITKAGFKTAWRRARARTAVCDFRFHDTRHTTATRLVRTTGNLKMAQQLLGHSSIAVTARYSHVFDHDLRAGMEAATPTESPAGGSAGAVNALKKGRN